VGLAGSLRGAYRLQHGPLLRIVSRVLYALAAKSPLPSVLQTLLAARKHALIASGVAHVAPQIAYLRSASWAMPLTWPAYAAAIELAEAAAWFSIRGVVVLFPEYTDPNSGDYRALHEVPRGREGQQATTEPPPRGPRPPSYRYPSDFAPANHCNSCPRVQ
jgi:hypothetical protein